MPGAVYEELRGELAFLATLACSLPNIPDIENICISKVCDFRRARSSTADESAVKDHNLKFDYLTKRFFCELPLQNLDSGTPLHISNYNVDSTRKMYLH